MAPSRPPSSDAPTPPTPTVTRPTLVAALGDVLTADLDESKFHFLHPRRIHWIQSPLDEKAANETELAPDETQEPQAEEVTATDFHQKDHGHAHRRLDLHNLHGPDPFKIDPDEPPLRYQSESSTIQLFYDLFFVANLTTFTAKHDVSNGPTLKSYVGYFSVLWFTWLQVALFDVRFGHDSAFERICKAVQFGVMVGLAIEGTNYDLKEFTPVTFRNISLILMFSRLVLLVQYAVALWWVKSYKKARLPLLAHITTMFLTAMVFLGLSFFFGRHDGVHILDGWYVVMGLEAVAVLFVSGKTSFLNFRRTNIIERLGLLTLIILGEGIMGLGEQVSKINDGDGVFSSDVVGEIICAVAIVYFIYMLYFDQTETKGKKVGSLQQQLWTIGHFPLHVCILLVVAGIGQFTVWRKVNDYYNGALNTIFAIQMPSPPNNGTADWQAYVDKLNGTLSQNYNGLSSNFSQPLADIIQDPGPDTAWNALYDILGTIAVVVAQGFGVDVEADDPEGGQFEILAIFSTVYLYFFISAGLVLILLACIFMLGKKTKTRVEYVSAGMRFAVGLGLVFLATMYIAYFDGSDGKPGDDFWNYFLSPWLTPTVALAYALVMGLDIVLILLSRMLYVRRGSVSSSVA